MLEDAGNPQLLPAQRYHYYPGHLCAAAAVALQLVTASATAKIFYQQAGASTNNKASKHTRQILLCIF